MLVTFRILLTASSIAAFSGNATAEVHTIKIGTDRGLLGFEPSKLVIHPGDEIIWLNNKLPPHNVIFDPNKIPTQNRNLATSLSHKKLLLTPGKRETTRFPTDAPLGDYHFHCEPHRGAGEVGVITVVEK